MSIALEGIGRPEFACGIGCFPAGESPGIGGESVIRNDLRPAEEVEQSYSSSIGKNSNCSDSDGGDSPEVQSRMKGPLETMDSLEDSLPIRRGLSKFYCSKSKSFTSLADAISSTSSSAKVLAKPQNPYTRKRKNLLACSKTRDKLDGDLSRCIQGCTPKKPANSNRSNASLTVFTSTTSTSTSNNSEEEQERYLLHPLRHPNGKRFASRVDTRPMGTFSFDMRSFSMADLQCVASCSPSFHPP